MSKKRENPTPIQDLEPNNKTQKRTKVSVQNKTHSKKLDTNGGGCGAALPSPMRVLSWNCRGLRSSPAIRLLSDEVKSKNPTWVFLMETKLGVNRIKGLQQKLELTQGITVPSDGRSGGLAMMWREGEAMCLKSCSNTHIDMVVQGESGANPWRATGFYCHPNTSKRYISWELLVALKNQCDMPWVVFGDFNEITHSDEKLGWLDRDALQMQNFRNCLSYCGLLDLGFVGQLFTWCNERFREQRTLVRLDRMLANEKWLEKFPKAQVQHVSMAASDHCLHDLSLRKSSPSVPQS